MEITNYTMEAVKDLDREIWEEYVQEVPPENRIVFPYRYYLLLRIIQINERDYNYERNES